MRQAAGLRAAHLSMPAGARGEELPGRFRNLTCAPSGAYARAMAKRRRRRSGPLAGAARAAANAPAHCKVKLGRCMQGRASKSKASHCMKSFWHCRRG